MTSPPPPRAEATQFAPGRSRFYSIPRRLEEIAEGDHVCTGNRLFIGLGPYPYPAPKREPESLVGGKLAA